MNGARHARAIPRPDALRYRTSDLEALGFGPLQTHHGCYSDFHVDQLRQLKAERPDFETVEVVFEGNNREGVSQDYKAKRYPAQRCDDEVNAASTASLVLERKIF